MLDKEENFYFIDIHTLRKVCQSLLYSKRQIRNRAAPSRDMLRASMNLLSIVVLTLLPYNLDIGETVTVYKTQKVLHQLSYDQATV